MAINAAKIMAGPARIFVGVTAGATGTPPTYISHTDGAPATGTDVGATEGNAEFKYQATKEEIAVEQELAPVDVWVTGEMAHITFTLQEMTYFSLQQAFDNVGKESIGAGDAFYFGGGTGILAPTTATVMLTSRQRNAPTKFVIAVLYKAYTVDGMTVPFSKAGKSMYSVTLKGLADTSRDAGDRLGYFRFEK